VDKNPEFSAGRRCLKTWHSSDDFPMWQNQVNLPRQPKRNRKLLRIACCGRNRRCRDDRCSPEAGDERNQRSHIGSVQTQWDHAGSFHLGSGRFQNCLQLSGRILARCMSQRQPACAALRDGLPVEGKSSSMPADHRLRGHDDQGLFPFGPKPSRQDLEQLIE